MKTPTVAQLRELLQGTREFFWDGVTRVDRPADVATGEIALFESGEELIERILDAIRLRRSVLITGPRGSGKSYCAAEAIARAKLGGQIGGSHFLQGNREIPRDYLSEDLLVIEQQGERTVPRLKDALVIRPPNMTDDEIEKVRAARGNELYPAVLSLSEGKESKTWDKGDDWVVLFLDEINRFGDGFLDSLLSLTEERVVVRSGTKLHVPIVVVATANPPGYDITAKKLSPPLQARISRAYRVSQPTHENLTYVILPDLIRRYLASYEQVDKAKSIPEEQQVRPVVAPEIRKLVSGAALCLWGIADPSRKGIGFLTPATQELLQRAARADGELARAMDELGQLVTFGPDARSVGDWIGCAMGLARREKGIAPHVTEEHLMECAIEALGHKVRETFNEGAEPLKVATKESLVSRIVRRVLTRHEVRQVFLTNFEDAVEGLIGWDLNAELDIPLGQPIVPAAPLGAEAKARKKARERFAFEVVRLISLNGRPQFVSALASAKDGAASIAQENTNPRVFSFDEVVLIDDVEASAEKLGVHDEALRKKLALHSGGWSEESKLALDPALHFEVSQARHPELGPWSDALTGFVKTHAAALSAPAAFREWFASVLILVHALRDAPAVRSSWLRKVSPALDDALRERDAAAAGSVKPPVFSEAARRGFEVDLRRLRGSPSMTERCAELLRETAVALKKDAVPELRPWLDAAVAAIAASPAAASS